MAVATLKKSDNSTVVSTTLSPATIRQMSKIGHAISVDNTFQQAKLATSAHDTLYSNATTNNPVSLGLDDIRQIPSYYPEK